MMPCEQLGRSIHSYPCWRFEEPMTSLRALIYNHSTHTIGTRNAKRAVAKLLRARGSRVGKPNSVELFPSWKARPARLTT